MPNWLPEIQNVVWNRNFEKLNMRNRFIQEGLKRFVKSMSLKILLKLDQEMSFPDIIVPSWTVRPSCPDKWLLRKLKKAVTINEIKEFMEKRFENVSLLWNRHLTFWIFDLAFFKGPEDHSQFIWPYIFSFALEIFEITQVFQGRVTSRMLPEMAFSLRKLTVRIYSILIVDIRLKLFTYK